MRSSERKAERVEAAIDASLRRAGIKPECAEDARAILRGAVEVDDKSGEVRRKAAPNVVPGQNVDQFIVGQLRTIRDPGASSISRRLLQRAERSN